MFQQALVCKESILGESKSRLFYSFLIAAVVMSSWFLVGTDAFAQEQKVNNLDICQWLLTPPEPKQDIEYHYDHLSRQEKDLENTLYEKYSNLVGLISDDATNRRKGYIEVRLKEDIGNEAKEALKNYLRKMQVNKTRKIEYYGSAEKNGVNPVREDYPLKYSDTKYSVKDLCEVYKEKINEDNSVSKYSEIYFDKQSNIVKIGVRPSYAKLVKAPRGDSPVAIEPGDEVVYENRQYDNSPYSSGSYIFNYSSCTLGFRIINNDSNRAYSLTAGHCGGGVFKTKSGRTIGSFGGTLYTPQTKLDAEFLYGQPYSGRYYVGGVNSSTKSKPIVAAYGSYVSGAIVGISGAVSGEIPVRLLRKIPGCVNQGKSWNSCQLFEFEPLRKGLTDSQCRNQNIYGLTKKGDSGAPVFAYTTQQGYVLGFAVHEGRLLHKPCHMVATDIKPILYLYNSRLG